jgi:hypothetical protein
MPDRLGHFQRAGAYRFERVPELENPNKATQSNYPAIVLIVAGSFRDEDADLIDRKYDISHGPKRGNISIIYQHISLFWPLSIICFLVEFINLG